MESIRSAGDPLESSPMTEVGKLSSSVREGNEQQLRESIAPLDCIKSSLSKRTRSEETLGTTATAAKAKRLPRAIPRLHETKGAFTFRKGVRVRDYQMPVSPAYPFTTNRHQFQGRDGFNRTEASLGYPQPMFKNEPKTEGEGHEREQSKRTPLSPVTLNAQSAASPSLGARSVNRDTPDTFITVEMPQGANREQSDVDDAEFQRWLNAG